MKIPTEQELLEELDRRAEKLGISASEYCKAHGVAASTLMRWRNGTYNMLSRRYRKLID